jgi:hypothetical protein
LDCDVYLLAMLNHYHNKFQKYSSILIYSPHQLIQHSIVQALPNSTIREAISPED